MAIVKDRIQTFDSTLGAWIEHAANEAPNRKLLQLRLDSIKGQDQLLCFLHRFLLFNDALAARLPFLAGLIHLTPELFLDKESEEAFCQRVNGRIAAYVAIAASDEYRITPDQCLVHQHLSQVFFKKVLAHFGVDERSFSRDNSVPHELETLLAQARSAFLAERGAEAIFTALGFHIGSEYYGHEEFSLVDAYLLGHHADLVASLDGDKGAGSAYSWIKIHTVLEVEHYQAALQAANMAVRYYHRQEDAPAMMNQVKHGFETFADLQRRYYAAILDNTAKVGSRARRGARV